MSFPLKKKYRHLASRGW